MADGWTMLKTPGNVAIVILLSVPLMLLNFLVVAGLVVLVAPELLEKILASLSSIFSGSFSVELRLIDLVFGVIGLALIMLLHELLHLAFIPGFLRSDKTWLGITYAGAYVVTEEVLTRRSFIIISLAPFIVLSVLLPVILGIAGMLSTGLIILAMLNAIGSSVDLLGLIMAITQAPSGSRIVCHGMDTYWKA